MTKAEARRIVRENMIHLMRALGISAWTIDVVYRSLNEDRDSKYFKYQMSVHMQPRYEKAMLKVDPDAIGNEADFLQCLRHELIHVMLSPFWSYDEDARQMLPPLNDMELRAMNQFYHDRYEALVLRVERMLDWGLNKSAKELVAVARRRWSDPKGRKGAG